MAVLGRFFFVLIAWLPICKCLAQSSWQALPNAPTVGSRHDDVFFINPTVGWVVNLGGEIYKTMDGGASWQLQLLGPNAFRSVGFADSLHGWAGTLDSDLLFQTRDGGATWTRVQNIPEPKPEGICGLSVVNAAVVYGCGRYNHTPRVIKTVDGGATWTTIDMSAHAGTLIDCYFLAPDSGFVVGGSPQGVFPSTIRAVVLFTGDGGRTWQNRFTTSRPGEWGWKISFPSRRKGYVSIERFGAPTYCLKTADGGLTWQEVFVQNLTLDVQGIGFATENKGWVAARRTEIFETSNGGITWQLITFGESINRFRMLSDTLGYAVGKAVYKYSPNTTAVAAHKTEKPSSAYFLAQNYPNPFNPATTIRYGVQRAGLVKLQVFDLSGKLVATLVDAVKPVGNYETQFEAAGLASGLYFYRLQAGGLVTTRKMLLAR
jgi:photosystem II stability/assembly factor-like uncharacterized protein